MVLFGVLITLGFHTVYHSVSVYKPSCWATVGYKNSEKVLQKSKFVILREISDNDVLS